MSQSEVLSWPFQGKTEESHQKTSVRTAGFQ